MASQAQIRQRPKVDGDHHATVGNVGQTTANTRKAERLAMAKRGARSLAIAIVLPLCLTAISLYSAGSPAIWALRIPSAACTALAGLSAWLFWVDGGFHRRPEALPLLLAQLAAGLAWPPLALGAAAPLAGVVAAAGQLAALIGCARCFRRVNPIAADLVKPCMVWAGFLAVVSFKLT